MSLRSVLPLTLLAVLSTAHFSPHLKADGPVEGVARVNGYGPYYIARPLPRVRQAPNPTYWTYMPKPFHLGCDWCMDPNCPGRNGIWTFPAVRWLLDPDYYALPPDFGWAPPDKMPVRREYVEYQKYHPETFYGMKGGGLKSSYPVIGQPTDTSQLGYYYQKVPQWQPNPGMLPGQPDPRTWHYRPMALDKDGLRKIRIQMSNVKVVPFDQLPNRHRMLHLRPWPGARLVPRPPGQNAAPADPMMDPNLQQQPAPVPPANNRAALDAGLQRGGV